MPAQTLAFLGYGLECNNLDVSNVLPFQPFVVKVIYDAEARVFVAECNDLVFVTEAPTFEALTERVWEIAPEMAQENGLHVAPENLRLRPTEY